MRLRLSCRATIEKYRSRFLEVRFLAHLLIDAAASDLQIHPGVAAVSRMAAVPMIAAV